MNGTCKPSIHRIPQRVIDTIFTKAFVREHDECWPWQLSLGNHGYGQVGWKTPSGKTAGTTAHRVSWIATFGPIPRYMTIDHLCRTRSCINPTHLRLLSNRENARDNAQSRKTHCLHGHPFEGENLRTNKRGWRTCVACQNERNNNRGQ